MIMIKKMRGPVCKKHLVLTQSFEKTSAYHLIAINTRHNKTNSGGEKKKTVLEIIRVI